jgi:hypothetical protein
MNNYVGLMSELVYAKEQRDRALLLAKATMKELDNNKKELENQIKLKENLEKQLVQLEKEYWNYKQGNR